MKRRLAAILAADLVGYTHHCGLGGCDDGQETHTRERPPKSSIGICEVEFPIEKVMVFRAASVLCVHIEAAMDGDRGLINMGKNDEVIPSRYLSAFDASNGPQHLSFDPH